MAMTASEAARSRYEQSFKSRIFEPETAPQGPAFIPAGKRRDQTTQEMFGNYNDKELRAMPKTFVPKDDSTSARQKQLNFLSSDVLPRTAYGGYPSSPQGGYPGPSRSKLDESIVEGDDGDQKINPQVRRQLELSSELFGRETPGVAADEAQNPQKRLTPSDFKWFSVPEPAQSATGGKDVTYQDRCYHEKCSSLYDHKSPKIPLQTQQEAQDQADESMGELKRRANAYYSDLSGRSPPMADPEQYDQRRPKL